MSAQDVIGVLRRQCCFAARQQGCDHPACHRSLEAAQAVEDLAKELEETTKLLASASADLTAYAYRAA